MVINEVIHQYLLRLTQSQMKIIGEYLHEWPAKKKITCHDIIIMNTTQQSRLLSKWNNHGFYNSYTFSNTFNFENYINEINGWHIRLYCDHNNYSIISINAGLLSREPLGTNFSKISIKIQNFSFVKMHLKISSAKWWPFCSNGDSIPRPGWVRSVVWNGVSFIRIPSIGSVQLCRVYTTDRTRKSQMAMWLDMAVRDR